MIVELFGGPIDGASIAVDNPTATTVDVAVTAKGVPVNPEDPGADRRVTYELDRSGRWRFAGSAS